MALQPDYTAGTITLTSGSTDFTTTGAALETAGIRAGDEIKLPAKGLTLTIATITGQNAGTLTDNCPAEAAGADQGYRIRFQSDLSRVAAYTRELIELLGAGNNEAFAELDGTDGNKLPYFTGIGEMATTALTAAARELLDDADAAAMLTTLGVSSFAKTLLDDADAAATLTTLGVSSFAKTLLDDADAAAARTTLGAQSALGFTPVQQGGGAGQQTNKLYLGWGVGHPKLQVDGTDLGRVWTDYEAYRDLNTIGEQRLPGGLTIKWGTVANPASDFRILFPSAFLTACYYVNCINTFPVDAANFIGISTSGVDRNGFDARCRNIGGGAVVAATNVPFLWIAVGV